MKFKKEEAREYLQQLVKKNWFKAKGEISYNIVTRLLENVKTPAKRLKSSAEYWREVEFTRECLKLDIS